MMSLQAYTLNVAHVHNSACWHACHHVCDGGHAAHTACDLMGPREAPSLLYRYLHMCMCMYVYVCVMMVAVYDVVSSCHHTPRSPSIPVVSHLSRHMYTGTATATAAAAACASISSMHVTAADVHRHGVPVCGITSSCAYPSCDAP